MLVLILLLFFRLLHASDVFEMGQHKCLETLQPNMSTKELELLAKINVEMSLSEKILLYRYFKQSNAYFELGMGGSTILACHLFPHLKIFAVDSSVEWVNKTRSDACIQQGEVQGRIELNFIDLGAVREWGYPASEERKHRWSDYSESIKKAAGLVDFILIDGRFRVASCLKAVYYCNPRSTRLAIHDFFNRPHYYDILRHTQVINCQDNLAVLRAKEPVDYEALLVDIKRFEHAPH